jgi:acetyltransferase-like isoleucine patch superfamily enzyme
MIYGYDDPVSGAFRKYTRISSGATIMSPERLSIGDHVWVWHYSILDATEGLSIGEGTQVGAWVGIFTHGSENSIRLLGKKFVDIPNRERPGYTRGSVSIGPYTFIGAGSVVLPGVKIGKGCLVAAMSLVTRDVPDYAIVKGQPAKVVGDTRDLDMKHFKEHDFSATYYDPEALRWIQEKLKKTSKKES